MILLSISFMKGNGVSLNPRLLLRLCYGQLKLLLNKLRHMKIIKPYGEKKLTAPIFIYKNDLSFGHYF